LAPLQRETRSVPIVFAQLADPVGGGFVASLARPGGNITGFTIMDFPTVGKWLELLKEIAPGVRRMTFMFSPPTAPWVPLFLGELGTAPASLAVEFSKTPVHDEAEIEAAITAFARERGVG
jgi:putative tryptophan/tyrosine transport system substrate-binding protein